MLSNSERNLRVKFQHCNLKPFYNYAYFEGNTQTDKHTPKNEIEHNESKEFLFILTNFIIYHSYSPLANTLHIVKNCHTEHCQPLL